MTKRVLILCTGNSCRSQMAEILWRHLAGSEWAASSAGTKPAGYVHPMAIAALHELGLETDGVESIDLEAFRGQLFDLVITVCDSAKESCPAFPGTHDQRHWPFDDPADATGTDEEKMRVFRRVRDEIREKIESFLATSP